MSQVIHFYRNGEPFYEFTNFARYPIGLKGKTWPTSEHYYQSQKHAGSSLEERIRLADSPREAFDLGRSQPNRSDWGTIRDAVMREAVLAKFTQHSSLQELLLSTGDALLVEHTENDRYWGDGGDGSGSNMLGQILMSVRSQLRLDAAQPISVPTH